MVILLPEKRINGLYFSVVVVAGGNG